MIIVNFSVLARPAESLPTRQPDSDGRHLWSIMYEANYGRMCLVVNERYENHLLEAWLKAEGYKPSFYEFIDDTQPSLKAERIHRLTSVFGKAQWYVDTDPLVCAETMKLGIPTLMVACPYVVRPEWGGEKNLKPWDTLVEEVNRQHLIRATRTWRDEI